jgi:hypothetical protein
MALGKTKLAESLKISIDKLNFLIDKTNIEDKNFYSEIEELEIRKEYLNLFKEKIKKSKEELKKDKQEFELYKEIEQNRLKEQLLSDELKQKTNFEEEKLRILAQLKNEFLENIRSEYTSVSVKLDEVIQKEMKLIQWKQDLDESQRKLELEKDLFNSKMEKLLNEHKQELEQKKEIFINQQEEIRLQKQEEVNKNIKKIFLLLLVQIVLFLSHSLF